MALDRNQEGHVNGVAITRGAPSSLRAMDRTQSQQVQKQRHRVSFQDIEEQSVSTSSPFNSPTSPNFSPQVGLAPRPSSMSYKPHRGGSRPHSMTSHQSSEPGARRRPRSWRDSDTSGISTTSQPLSRSFSARARAIPLEMEELLEEDESAPMKRQKEPVAPIERSLSNPITSKTAEVATASEMAAMPQTASEGPTAERPANGTRKGPPHAPGQVSSFRRSVSLNTNSSYGREWAPDRSPLQKLELTLQDITKEERRAQLEEDLLVREARAGHARRRGTRGDRSSLMASTIEAGGLRTSPLAEAGLVRSLSSKRREQIRQSAMIESRKPQVTAEEHGRVNGSGFEYQEQQYVTSPVSESIERRPYSSEGSTPVQGDRSGVAKDAPRYARDDMKGKAPAYDRGASTSSHLRSPDPSPVSRRKVSVSEKDVTRRGNKLERLLGLNADAARLAAPLDRRASGGAQPLPDTSKTANGAHRKRKATVRLTRADLDVVELPRSTAGVKKAQEALYSSGGLKKAVMSKKPDLRYDDAPLNPDPRKDNDPTTFRPPLHLKCGPLLRFLGTHRESGSPVGTPSNESTPVEREWWRGSIMIVTTDLDSSYNPPPTLRLFSQPMDLLPAPPAPLEGDHPELPAEVIDPVAGLPKMTRTGGVMYVKPVDHLEPEADLSRIEDDSGLFETTRSPPDPPDHDDSSPRKASLTHEDRLHPVDGEKAGKYQQVQGECLQAERGIKFWRFSIEVELGDKQTRIGYRINRGPAIGFWVPAQGDTMNVMFHSCNGFSLNVNPAQFSGPDPMWRDVLNAHQVRPFHAMIGGGDQIYNDSVMKQSGQFQAWFTIKNPLQKHSMDFTADMQEELETYYLERYCMWFSQGLFGMANSQIPMINIWDDHDIIDGFGSYPDHFMMSPVFCGLGAIAFKYYMLFQHQSTARESSADEPSWLLGASLSPYIGQLSRSVLMFLGRKVAFLGIDCRTERTRDEILSERTYDAIFDRCRREIIKGETKHLIVLLGVPIAYPRLVWLETMLTSRIMDPVKALGRSGVLGGFTNRFDGGVEILDDLDDHWTGKNHKAERNWFIQELQQLAAEKSVRVTILGGDVHLAAVGQFYSTPSLGIPKHHDHRYMPNIISSAIVNAPPPEMLADVLNKRNKVHHLDIHTDEDMIPLFTHDVDGKVRNNKCLLPRRNWCSIREYVPGSTPPPTPPPEDVSLSATPEPQPPKLTRTLSLSRKEGLPGKLFRRLSRRDRDRPNTDPPGYESPTLGVSQQDDHGHHPSRPDSKGKDYFPLQSNPPARLDRSSTAESGSQPMRPNPFHRRPTDLSESKKGPEDDGESQRHLVNLEDGLDVTLNVEVNAKDPAGITVPYRLLVPALWSVGDQAHLHAGSTSVQATQNTPALASSSAQDEYDQERQEAERELDIPQRKKSLRQNLLRWVGSKRRSVSQPQSYLDPHQGYDEDEGEGVIMPPASQQQMGVTTRSGVVPKDGVGRGQSQQQDEDSWSEDDDDDEGDAPSPVIPKSRQGPRQGPYRNGDGVSEEDSASETDDSEDDEDHQESETDEEEQANNNPRNIGGSYRGGRV
ncbi:MAG: hypothetical protein M1823_001788 [Watsoniomyces obsoletus]|nr:MAG: hypothetical protein M1823_001788 [Watsoniomyces obsoletus]